MANVWGFPYKLGANGGGAFLIAYLLFVVICSYVGLSTEYAVGRRAKTGTVGAYAMAWKSGKKEGFIGRNIGWFPLAGSLCIALGYAIIISYVMKGLWQALTGSLMSVDTNIWFDSFALKDFSVLPLHLAVLVITILTLIFGAESIEKTNKLMMPLFFILFVIMAISLTGSGMIVYGAYLSDKEDVVTGAKDTAFFDTLAALVAAVVMIPACFAYGMDPAGGPGLLFVTLPKILQNMPGGRLFAIVLYLAIVFGGISSLQNMLEAVLESIGFRFPKLKRGYILAALFIICMGIGAFIEPIYKWGPWMDIVSIYIIPIGATIGAISWFWVVKKEDLLDEINKARKNPVSDTWYLIGKYIYVPLALVLCIIALYKGISF